MYLNYRNVPDILLMGLFSFHKQNSKLKGSSWGDKQAIEKNIENNLASWAFGMCKMEGQSIIGVESNFI